MSRRHLRLPWVVCLQPAEVVFEWRQRMAATHEQERYVRWAHSRATYLQSRLLPPIRERARGLERRARQLASPSRRRVFTPNNQDHQASLPTPPASNIPRRRQPALAPNPAPQTEPSNMGLSVRSIVQWVQQDQECLLAPPANSTTQPRQPASVAGPTPQPEPTNPGPRSRPVAQQAQREREQQWQSLNKDAPPTPPQFNTGPSARSVAQRARRERERQQQSLNEDAPQTPPQSNTGSSARSVAQRARRERERQEGLSGSGTPPSVSRRAGRCKH